MIDGSILSIDLLAQGAICNSAKHFYGYKMAAAGAHSLPTVSFSEHSCVSHSIPGLSKELSILARAGKAG